MHVMHNELKWSFHTGRTHFFRPAGQTFEAKVRFHRHNFRTAVLAQINHSSYLSTNPEIPQCYLASNRNGSCSKQRKTRIHTFCACSQIPEICNKFIADSIVNPIHDFGFREAELDDIVLNGSSALTFINP